MAGQTVDITINLLASKNAVPTVNDVSLALNYNEFFIVAGENNATLFEINPSYVFSGYDFYVKIVDPTGGYAEAKLEAGSSVDWIKSSTTFVFPEGACEKSGYAHISIRAEYNDITVVFMPVKVPVQKTAPSGTHLIPGGGGYNPEETYTHDTTTTTITHELRNKNETTYSASNISTVMVTIPNGTQQGFVSEVDFFSGTIAPTLSVVNAGSKPFKFYFEGEASSSFVPSPEKEIDLLFRDNGANIICTVIEIG